VLFSPFDAKRQLEILRRYTPGGTPGTHSTSGTYSFNCTVGGGGIGESYLSDCQMYYLFGPGGEYTVSIRTPELLSGHFQDPPEMCVRAFNDTNWHSYNMSGVGASEWGLDYIQNWIVSYEKCHHCSDTNYTCGQVAMETVARYPSVQGAKVEYVFAIQGMYNGQAGDMTMVVNSTVGPALYSYCIQQQTGYSAISLYMWKNNEMAVLEAGINASTSVQSLAATVESDMP
jgi:hypothetical protein